MTNTGQYNLQRYYEIEWILKSNNFVHSAWIEVRVMCPVPLSPGIGFFANDIRSHEYRNDKT